MFKISASYFILFMIIIAFSTNAEFDEESLISHHTLNMEAFQEIKNHMQPFVTYLANKLHGNDKRISSIENLDCVDKAIELAQGENNKNYLPTQNRQPESDKQETPKSLEELKEKNTEKKTDHNEDELNQSYFNKKIIGMGCVVVITCYGIYTFWK